MIHRDRRSLNDGYFFFLMNLPSSSQIDIDLDNQWTSRLPGCVEENEGGRSLGQEVFL